METAVQKDSIVCDYDQTVDIEKAAKKHRRCIEQIWASRVVLEETVIYHQDMMRESNEAKDDYFKSVAEIKSSKDEIASARKACRVAHQEAWAKKAKELSDRSSNSSNPDTGTASQ